MLWCSCDLDVSWTRGAGSGPGLRGRESGGFAEWLQKRLPVVGRAVVEASAAVTHRQEGSWQQIVAGNALYVVQEESPAEEEENDDGLCCQLCVRVAAAGMGLTIAWKGEGVPHCASPGSGGIAEEVLMLWWYLCWCLAISGLE